MQGDEEGAEGVYEKYSTEADDEVNAAGARYRRNGTLALDE